MSTRLVGFSATATVRLKSVPVFRGNCEVLADPLPGGGSARLDEARFTCQRGAAGKSRSECERCPRFRGWRQGEASQDLAVSCHWAARDPVSARMTTVAALVTVKPDTSCLEADALAHQHDVHHLPVVVAGKLRGIVSRSDFFPRPRPDEPVNERMALDIFALTEGATLGEALAAMILFKVGCLPVVEGEVLVGLITRGDLRAAGIVDTRIEVGACCSCGGRHGIRSDPRRADIQLCLDCLQRAEDDYASLGLGEAD